MAKTHQKRRNAFLMSEFLIRKISRCLVEGDKKGAAAALKIIKQHFKPGTELHRELRLMTALYKTTVTSPGVATSIIQEARAAAQKYDMSLLDREKSLLIRNVNHRLNDDTLFEQSVPDYRIHATIQTLLNEWRKPEGTRDIELLAKFEDQLVTWLVSEKTSIDDMGVIEEMTVDPRLLTKVMMNKLNEKYSSSLSKTQKDILRSYAFSTSHNRDDVVKNKLDEVRTQLITDIDSYIDENPNDKTTNESLVTVKGRLLNESLDTVDDEKVSRFMLYVKLRDELSASEEAE